MRKVLNESQESESLNLPTMSVSDKGVPAIIHKATCSIRMKTCSTFVRCVFGIHVS